MPFFDIHFSLLLIIFCFYYLLLFMYTYIFIKCKIKLTVQKGMSTTASLLGNTADTNKGTDLIPFCTPFLFMLEFD